MEANEILAHQDTDNNINKDLEFWIIDNGSSTKSTMTEVNVAHPLDLGDLRAVSVLGRGAKGVVFLVQVGDGRLLALKAISRSNIENKKEKGSVEDQYRRIWFERDVLSVLRFPLLPSLRGFVSTDEIIGFAIDRCSGGDLGSLLKRQTENMFSEDIIRFYAAELVLVLEHLHGLGIAYRDLKPGNILIQDSGHLMLVDFDLSKKLPLRKTLTSNASESNLDEVVVAKRRPPRHHHPRFVKSWFSCKSRSSSAPDLTMIQEESEAKRPPIPSPRQSVASTTSSSTTGSSTSSTKSNSFVGTEEYVAPEIVQGKGHDFAVDWWGLGVVLYEMLYGKTPFRGQNRKETFYRILTKEPDLVGEKTPLRVLIRKLLDKDPNTRICVKDIKQAEFFRNVDWNSVVEIFRPPFIPADEENSRGGSVLDDVIDVEKYVKGIFENNPKSTNDSFENLENTQNNDKKENCIETSDFLGF